MGAGNVAIGSGWDSGLPMAAGVDSAGLGMVSEGLRKGGLSEEDIEQVMGGSILRAIRVSLPTEVRSFRNSAYR